MNKSHEIVYVFLLHTYSLSFDVVFRWLLRTSFLKGQLRAANSDGDVRPYSGTTSIWLQSRTLWHYSCIPNAGEEHIEKYTIGGLVIGCAEADVCKSNSYCGMCRANRARYLLYRSRRSQVTVLSQYSRVWKDVRNSAKFQHQHYRNCWKYILQTLNSILQHVPLVKMWPTVNQHTGNNAQKIDTLKKS